MSFDRTKPNVAAETGGNLDSLTGFEREQLRLLEAILSEVRVHTLAILNLGSPQQDDPERLRDLSPTL